MSYKRDEDNKIDNYENPINEGSLRTVDDYDEKLDRWRNILKNLKR